MSKIEDYLPKGIEIQECEISSVTVANFVKREIYRDPWSAWRELVSNAWDAMRFNDEKGIEKIVKIRTDVAGDAEIEDWGHAIPDTKESLRTFLGIGKNPSQLTDQNQSDMDRIGQFGVGKNSALALSKLETVQFFSHADKEGEKLGLIVTVFSGENKPIMRAWEPKDSARVLDHPGLKVRIAQVDRMYADTDKLIDHLSKWFAYKIARRGFKIYVDGIVVKAPEKFNPDKKLLFRLDDGSEVWGNLRKVDKPKSRNIDFLVKEVFIEAHELDYKVEGWINYDFFKLTTARDAINTDARRTVFPEFWDKFQEYLAKRYERKDSHDVSPKHERKWGEVAKQTAKLIAEMFPEYTLDLFKPLANKFGFMNAEVLKAGTAWQTFENKNLLKSDTPVSAGSIKVRRVRGKKRKKQKARRKSIEPVKTLNEPEGQPVPTAYDMVDGKGNVAVLNNQGENDVEESRNEIEFRLTTANAGKEKPLVYVDLERYAIVRNIDHAAVKMFNNPKSDGARNEIVRAIVSSLPENKDKDGNLKYREIDSMYIALLDGMMSKDRDEGE